MRDCLADIAALAEIDLLHETDAYSEAMRHAYWDDKDLSGASAIAFAGISRMLAEARTAESGAALELRSQAKRLTYDLASFTWPGWDEPGIIVTPPEMRAGHAAARANLRMAEELEKGDLALSRAHWMLGAHELSSGHPAEAHASFTQAAELAAKAGAPAEGQLALAFAALAAVALDASQRALLDEALARLEAADGGADLIGQVTTAREALGI